MIQNNLLELYKDKVEENNSSTELLYVMGKLQVLSIQ